VRVALTLPLKLHHSLDEIGLPLKGQADADHGQDYDGFHGMVLIQVNSEAAD